MKKSALLITLVLLSSCAEKKGPAAQNVGSTAPSGNILAHFNGEPITDEDIRKVAGPKLAQAEMDLYDARREGIDQLIADKLLEMESKKQGMAKEEFLKKNLFDKIKIEDKDVEKFYNEQKAQMQGKTLDEVKSNIQGFLSRDKSQKIYGDLIAGLQKKAQVEILIQAPRVKIEEGDSPAIGPKDAPITVIEFTDYQCPFCGRSRPTVNQILEEYKGKVRYVLRDFPLSFHQDSEKAHEAAHCAGEQGKYWDMNKKLFSDQQAIKMDDLKKYAADLKLNTTKFNECLDSGKFADKVRQNQEYGEQVGVNGTPAFFVNGRMISGARPFEFRKLPVALRNKLWRQTRCLGGARL